MPVKTRALLKTPAAAADRWYEVREQRYALQKQVDALAAEESQLREFIINTLPKSQASGITGRVAHAEIKKKNIPQVKSWPLFYAHILKTKDFSFLQRRVSDKAVEERWAANKAVPGVQKFTAITVSLTKK